LLTKKASCKLLYMCVLVYLFIYLIYLFVYLFILYSITFIFIYLDQFIYYIFFPNMLYEFYVTWLDGNLTTNWQGCRRNRHNVPDFMSRENNDRLNYVTNYVITLYRTVTGDCLCLMKGLRLERDCCSNLKSQHQ
jgi:hypothetical protein